MAKEVKLARGYAVAIVDDADYDRVSREKWHIVRRKRATYAQGSIKQPDGTWKKVRMHRFILGVTDERRGVDHVDHDGLNNQRVNLRVCTSRENNANKRKLLSSVSMWKGVTPSRPLNSGQQRWRARIRIDGVKRSIGLFNTQLGAAAAYNAAAYRQFGEFAFLNDLSQSTNNLNRNG